MRTLTATLLAAQKRSSATPYVRVRARSLNHGVARYSWSRLYSGSEPDYLHGATLAGDGSLIRARVAPPPGGRNLYYQRVADPGPTSDFTNWTYSGQYGILAVAVAGLGAEVSIFWVQLDRAVKRIISTDYGQTWGSPETIDYTNTTQVSGMAAAYRPDGDLAVFFTDQSTLWAEVCVDGVWETKSGWGKTTGALSGVACLYDGDWDLVVSGQDSSGNYRLWSLVYGDGGDVAPGVWSALKDLASAPYGGPFNFVTPFVDKPDQCRLFYIEKYTGTESYSRPFSTCSLPGSSFVDGLWREPLPFDLSSGYGLAMAHHGDYCWLASPSGVWRAGSTLQTVDVTGDVTGVKQELAQDRGKITVELRNDRGQYAAPGQGALAALDIGAQIDFEPGYLTTAGNEVSAGQSFTIEGYEYTSSGGRGSLLLHAGDGWAALECWKARHQFRWNKSASEMNVKDIVAFVLARVGIKMEIKSQSDIIAAFYPDFTINVGENGVRLIQKLLSLVPDLVFVEGNLAYLVNPLSSDASVYSYGTDHPILEGRYGCSALAANWAQVEGSDPVTGNPILASTFNWDEMERLNDRLVQIEDQNLASTEQAQQRGEAILRKAELQSRSGLVRVPVNCGQQLYDVVEITDVRSGLAAEKRRVMGIALSYSPARGEYQQRILLGAV